MLKKANKRQIIKNIDVENSFIDENSFYVPVVLNVNESLFFDVKSICVSITPKNFVYKSLGNRLDETQRLNSGFTLKEKPLFVNSSSNNTAILESSDIEQSSTNNNLFKKLYSRNIVSSQGQEEFLEYQTPVFFDDQNVTQVKTFINIIPLNLVEEKTVSIEQQPGDSRQIKNYCDIIINVYALNSKKEVVDNFSIESKKINEYEVNTDFESIRLIEIENALNTFVNSFNILFTPYNFPISESFRLGNLNGVDVSFDKSILNSIFLYNGFSNEVSQRLDVNITQNNINTSYNLTSIRSTDFFIFDEINSRRGNAFSNSLINSSTFQAFISDINDYLNTNNLNEIELDLSFNLVYTNSSLNITRKIIINKNSIKNLNKDFLRYKFEKDLIQKKVISANLSKFRDNNILKVYRLKIKLNLESYSKLDIIENGLSLTFVKRDYSELNNIEKFYFDDALTEGNSININSSNIIKNYFLEEDELVLYFQSAGNFLNNNDIIGCYINFFNAGNRESLKIGLFPISLTDERLRNINTELLNIYDICSDLIEQQTSFINDTSDIEFIRSILKVEEDYRYKINMTNLISNSSLKKIGYFNNANNSIQEKINQLINNVVVKNEKVLVIGDTEVRSQITYNLMSDLYLDYEDVNGNVNIILYERNLRKILQDFDVENRLSGSDILEFIMSVRRNQETSYVIDEYVTYINKISYIIMKEGTISNFGESNNVSSYKQNLLDFIISSNPNFKTTAVNILRRNLFNELFFENKNKLISNIFSISGINQEKYITNEIRAKKSDFNINISESNNQNNNNIFNPDFNNITNVLFENIQKCATNIKANLFRSNIILEKKKDKRDFVLQGSNVASLITSYQNSNRSFIQESFFYPEIILDSEFNSSNGRESDELVFLKDNEKAFVTFKNSNILNDYKNNLTVKIENNQIIANIVNNNIDFKRFNKDYYSLVLTYLKEEKRRNISFSSQSIRDRERTLLVGNIMLRICIIFNIDDSSYFLIKNVIVEPTEDLKAYVNYASYNLSKDKLNINFLDLENNIYMPSISYKGMRK